MPNTLNSENTFSTSGEKSEVPNLRRSALIVDDERFVGGMLTTVLETHGYDAQAVSDALSAKEIITTFDPDIALLDIDLGDGPNGLELMTYIVRMHPEIAVVLMTGREAITQGLKLPEGVAFILKHKVTDTDALIEVMESTLRGHGSRNRHNPGAHSLTELSKNQLEVLKLIALGYSNARIAEARSITLSGAEQAVSRVIRQLGIEPSDDLSPRVEAARRYIAARGIPRPPK